MKVLIMKPQDRVHITFRIPKKLCERMEAQIEEMGLTRSGFIITAIYEALRNTKSTKKDLKKTREI